jgi:hypothetical protein
MNDKVIPILPERACGECTACCEGWLSGEAHGHEFQPGQPCFYLQKGCGIYETRPEEPCKTYKCVWLKEDTLPLWMRPDKSKAIVTERDIEGIKYWDVSECGETLKSEVLSWLVMHTIDKQANLQYRINSGAFKIGQADFLAQ